MDLSKFDYLKAYWDMELVDLEYDLWQSDKDEDKELHSRIEKMDSLRMQDIIERFLTVY